jgi:glycosyltransferase 2 family protein
MQGMKSSPWQSWVSLGIGVSISLMLLAWILQGVRWSEVWLSLQQAHWGWLVLGWLCYLLSYGVRARRWGQLLKPWGQTGTFAQRCVAIFIGFGANCVLPAHLGDFLRADLLHRQGKVSPAASIGSVVAERILDVGIVLIFLLLPIALNQLPPVLQLKWMVLIYLAIGLLVLWLLCLLAVNQQQWGLLALQRCMAFLHVPLPLQRRAQNLGKGFLGGLSALADPRRCLQLLAASAVVWLLNGVTYWAALVAFNITQPGFWGALFIQSGTALAIALPSTPGYLGPFEAGIKATLGLYDIPLATLLSYAIALRVQMYITIPAIATVLWLLLFWRKQPSKA